MNSDKNHTNAVKATACKLHRVLSFNADNNQSVRLTANIQAHCFQT